MNSGILASVAKELAIFDFPFLFANEKESDAVVDGPVGKKMHGLLQDKGIERVAHIDGGYAAWKDKGAPVAEKAKKPGAG